HLGLAGLLATGNTLLVFASDSAWAQIIPDQTLGHERSRVTRNVEVRGNSADRIDGGAVRGTNLFHSFREFNVGDQQRVYFNQPAGIENILSRVTGSDVSDIMGTLGVLGNANLFLLNPNGIVFGPHAQLDVRGSFLATTADRFTFPDGSEFSAIAPQPPPLLTLHITPGLQFGATPGNIANQGHLTVGQNLTLAGNTLDLQGSLVAGNDLQVTALDTLRIRDSVDVPFIAASGGSMLLQGNQAIDIFALNHPNSGLFSGSDMVLRSPQPISGDAHFWSGGNFRIEQLDGQPGIWLSLHDPIIRASGNVAFNRYTGASLHVFAGGSVNAGSITITGTDPADPIHETVPLSDGTSFVEVSGDRHPTVDIRAGTL
ncbi:MAG TPA: filamentous hemagglutinin N-terminal domain-containing protein, partial [Allocoleopsis sp.]